MSDWITVNPKTLQPVATNDDWVTVSDEPAKPEFRLGPKPGTEQVATSRERSLGERMSEAYDRATSIGGQGEIGRLIRRLDDFFNINSRKTSADLNLTPEQTESYQDIFRARKARTLRKLWARIDEIDPAWRENGSIVGNVARFAAELLGDAAGNANPTYLLAPGRTAAARIAAQGGINAGLDAVIQAGEIDEGIADNYDPSRTFLSALAGALMQGTGEGASVLWRKTFPDVSDKAIVSQEGEFDSLESLQDAYARTVEANEQIKKETGADASNFKEIRNKFVDYAQRNFNEADIEPITVEAGRPSLEEQLAGEAEQFLANRPQEPTVDDIFEKPFDETEGLNRFLNPDRVVIQQGDIEAPDIEMPRVFKEDVEAVVSDITRGWQNAPEFEIVQKADEIVDPVAAGMAQDLNVLGFVGDDGKVRIIADHLQHPDEINAVVFHEALGHKGLAAKFNEGLDDVLESMYHSGGKFREDVDAWMERNPGAYGDDPNLLARSVEEVLAEMSEAGPIDVKLMDRVKNYIKEIARKAGITLKFSDREIRAIMGMAHDAVINGKANAADNGFRYMRRRNTVGDSTGAEAVNTSRSATAKNEPYVGMGKIRSNRNVEEILREGAAPVDAQSWGEWISAAEQIRMTGKKAKGLEAGTEVPELLAARDYVLKSANRIADISRKIAEGKGTAADEQLLAMEMIRNADIQDAIAGVRSNAARIVNSFKIEVANDKALMAGIRTMARESTAMGSSEGIRRMARQIAENADNPEAVAKIAKDSLKPLPEDYITSLRYSAMLSGLGTPVKAIVGTMSNMMFKSLQDLAAVGIGAAKRPFTKTERLTLYEWGMRQQGMVRSLNEALAQAKKSWKEGTAVNAPDRLEVGHADLPFSYITEYPKRNLAAIDGFFREVINGAEFYGLANRKALGERLVPGSKEFDARVKELVDNPTEDMIKIATREADQQQFLSNDSPLLRMLEMGKLRKPEMSFFDRTLRFAINHVFPFSRNIDNVIRQALRNSPAGVLSKTVQSDWKAGGVRRDQAIARLAVGTTLLSIAGQMALDGLATGTGSSDYDRAQQDLAAGKLPNAVLIDGEWVPLDGFDSIAVPFNTWASTVLAYNNKEISDEDFVTKAIEASKAMTKALYENTVLEQLSRFTSMFDSRSGNNEFIVGGASSFVPAIVRQQAQWGIVGEGDRAIRDSTGDGSLSDRIIGRILTSLPETPRDYLIEKFDLSKVPQRMDVYGRPLEREGGKLEAVTTIDRGMKVDDNPAIQEVQRLSEGIKGALVSPVDKDITVDGEKIKLTPEERQKYQYFAGATILLELEAAIVDPVWKELTDDEKREEIKLIVKESKKMVREELFAKYYEQEEEEPKSLEEFDYSLQSTEEGYIDNDDGS